MIKGSSITTNISIKKEGKISMRKYFIISFLAICLAVGAWSAVPYSFQTTLGVGL